MLEPVTHEDFQKGVSSAIAGDNREEIILVVSQVLGGLSARTITGYANGTIRPAEGVIGTYTQAVRNIKFV